MVSKVIIIRHGITQRDKSNPQRRLTKPGIKGVERVSKQLKPLINKKSCEIICTNTTRAQQTAEILSKNLNVPIRKKKYDLKVNNLGQLDVSEVTNVVDFYFSVSAKGKLPRKVPSPKTVTRRFLKAIIEPSKELYNLIIVSHSVAIESFIKFQDIYKVEGKEPEKLDYAQFVSMKKLIEV